MVSFQSGVGHIPRIPTKIGLENRTPDLVQATRWLPLGGHLRDTAQLGPRAKVLDWLPFEAQRIASGSSDNVRVEIVHEGGNGAVFVTPSGHVAGFAASLGSNDALSDPATDLQELLAAGGLV